MIDPDRASGPAKANVVIVRFIIAVHISKQQQFAISQVRITERHVARAALTRG